MLQWKGQDYMVFLDSSRSEYHLKNGAPALAVNGLDELATSWEATKGKR